MLYNLKLKKSNVYNAVRKYLKNCVINDKDLRLGGYTLCADGELNGNQIHVIINLLSTEIYFTKDKQIKYIVDESCYWYFDYPEINDFVREIYESPKND